MTSGAYGSEVRKIKAFGSNHPLVLMGYFRAVLLTAVFVSNPVLQTEALFGGILF